MFAIGVFAILFDQHGRVLLCHRRDADLWTLPGGGLEHGEAPWAGVVREVKEETGLEVAVERLAGVYSKPEVNEIVFSFVCTVTGGVPTLNDEADGIDYFALESIPPNTSRKQVERVRDIAEGASPVVLKEQRGPSSRLTGGQIGSRRG